MNTGSAVIQKTVAILSRLNYYFEYSFIYRLMAVISKAASNSLILKAFLSTDYKDYWQGSFILRPLAFAAENILMAMRRLFLFIAKANESSLNRKLFYTFAVPLTHAEGYIAAASLWLGGFFLAGGVLAAVTMLQFAFFTSGEATVIILGYPPLIPPAVFLSVTAAAFIFCGIYLPKFLATAFKNCVPIRLVRWFFGRETDEGSASELILPINLREGQEQSIKRQLSAFRLLHILLGAVMWLMPVLLPSRLSVVLIGGLAYVIFTFFNLKLSYMLFFLGMLIVPHPFWNNMLILLSAIFYAGVYGIKWFLTSSAKPSFKHISPALVLFSFFCFLSVFTGFGGMDSLRVFVILFACMIHSVLVINIIKSKDDLRLFFLILAVAVVLTSLFGLYQFTMGIEIRAEFTDLTRSRGLSRLYSTLGNPNNDAESWSMLLPFVLAAAITTKSDVRRVILAGIFFICLTAFALTYSRAGYVALMAGMGVFVLMSAPRLVPVALVVLLLSIPFLPASIIERLLTLGQDTSSLYRIRIWEGTLRMLENFWVQGIGMGPSAFISIYRGYAHPSAWNAMHAHNMFLNILAHSGIGALLAFTAYLFRLFKQGISSHMACADREFKIYMAAGIGALTSFTVFGMGEYVWFYPRVMLVFWLMSGLIPAMVQMHLNGADAEDDKGLTFNWITGS